MYRILLLCREGSRLVHTASYTAWEYVWHWHTWTIEDSVEDAVAEARRLRVDLNPMVKSLRIIGVDDYY